MKEQRRVTATVSGDLLERVHVTGRYYPNARAIVFDPPVEIPSGGTLSVGEVNVSIEK